MAKGTKLSEFEKGVITALKRLVKFQRENFESRRMQFNRNLQLLEKFK